MLELGPRDELLCLRAAEPVAECSGMVLPAIAQASIFRKETMEELHRDLARENAANVYSRGTNPTVQVLERTLAELERGEACKCFASGMGAIGATLFGLLKAGDHVLFVNDIYGPTLELARRLEDFGVSHDQVFTADIAAIGAAMRDETRMVFMESPGSTLFQRIDVRAIAKLAREHGALSVIDTASGEVVRTIVVSSVEEAMERTQVTILFSPDGERIYVAETTANTIAEVDFASGRSIATGEDAETLEAKREGGQRLAAMAEAIGGAALLFSRLIFHPSGPEGGRRDPISTGL